MMKKIHRGAKYLGPRLAAALALLYFLAEFPFQALFVVYQNY